MSRSISAGTLSASGPERFGNRAGKEIQAMHKRLGQLSLAAAMALMSLAALANVALAGVYRP